MSDHCCDDKAHDLSGLRARQAWVLKVALVLNASLFVVEFFGGLILGSSSLQADSLDMLGDAWVYGLSLAALGQGEARERKAALMKGCTMLVLGLGVLVSATYRWFHQVLPDPPAMSWIAASALATNLICFGLLYRHRDDSINMKSTWICTRNDVISNLSVLCAAWAVHAWGQSWPDAVVGLALSGLMIGSSFGVLKDALNSGMPRR
jgi:cation diffusion facilitator family transporter